MTINHSSLRKKTMYNKEPSSRRLKGNKDKKTGTKILWDLERKISLVSTFNLNIMTSIGLPEVAAFTIPSL